MRKIIAALVISLDGFIEGPNGEMDWIRTREDPFDLFAQIDTCILGRKMYPGYELYWRAVLADPEGPSPFTGRAPTAGEIRYARFADRTPHFVVSKTLESVAWANTRIVRDIEEIRQLKQSSGKDMYAVGGAALVSGLMNLGLIDELRLVIAPIVLGAGKPLFEGVEQRRTLNFLAAKELEAGAIRLTYATSFDVATSQG